MIDGDVVVEVYPSLHHVNTLPCEYNKVLFFFLIELILGQKLVYIMYYVPNGSIMSHSSCVFGSSKLSVMSSS